jgi:hypothetical protein
MIGAAEFSVGGSRRPSYTAVLRRRESAGRRLALGLAASLVLMLSIGGCGLSFSIPSLVADEEPTGAIPAKPVSPLSPGLDAEDWRRARSAMAVALDPVGNGSASRWDNPASGAKGTFAPAGGPYVKNDEICRAFTATLAGGTVQQAFQGTACRPSGGEWTIDDLKPR